MRVLVTGATGYIGSVVAERLAEAGHAVVGLARSDDAARILRDRGLESARGDLESPDSLVEPSRDADAVVHVAATGGDEWAEADEGSVRVILSALEGTNKPFVYTSGIWVLGDTGDAQADEEYSGQPLEMVRWRLGVEEQVLDAAERDVRATVVRPGIVYGRGGGMLAMLVAEAGGGAVRVVGDGRQLWPVVHVEDLADLYLRLLDADPGGVYHGVAGPSYTLRDLALGAVLATGGRAEVVEWPVPEARREIGPFADAQALSQRVSAARAREDLGWEPRGATPFEELVLGSYRE